MFAFIRQPYVFAVTLALVTAVLSYLYARITDSESKKSYQTFFKTLAAGLIAGLVLTYISSPKSEPVATEPFDAAPGLGAIGI